jgi:hypothetical protein
VNNIRFASTPQSSQGCVLRDRQMTDRREVVLAIDEQIPRVVASA